MSLTQKSNSSCLQLHQKSPSNIHASKPNKSYVINKVTLPAHDFMSEQNSAHFRILVLSFISYGLKMKKRGTSIASGFYLLVIISKFQVKAFYLCHNLQIKAFLKAFWNRKAAYTVVLIKCGQNPTIQGAQIQRII